jgi:D-alanine-D-alanine ligase-like ATP-grasp enzyme/acylphosphatase
MSTQDPPDAEEQPHAAPPIEAATAANQALLRRIMAAGENDFSASPFLRPNRGNPVYALLGAEARRRGYCARIVRDTHVEIRDPRDHDRVLAVFSPNSPDLALAARRVTNNKVRTKTVLQAAGVPVPRGEVFRDFDLALAYLERCNRPQVVKPMRGSGGNGVSVGITTPAQFRAAWERAASSNFAVVLEDFVVGDELRLIVLGGEVVGAVCRIPAHVVGDGRLTIRELVARKNAVRKRNPLMRLYPVDEFDYLRDVLGKGLDERPAPGEYVRLSSVSNVAKGGEAVSLTGVLHPSFHTLARRVFDAIPGATQLGLDVITTDFAADALGGNAVVIEVNSDPAIGTPCFAAYGPPASEIAVRAMDWVERQARGAARRRQDAPAPSLAPANTYHATCDGATFPRNYGTQIRLLRQAAYARGLRVERVDAETTLVGETTQGEGTQRHLLYQGMSDATPVAARRASHDKHWTKALLAQAGVRTPRGEVFAPDACEAGWAFALEIGLPVVVKPLAGSGGKGVTARIESREAFLAAWDEACQSRMPKIVVEEHVPGRNYRVFVVGQRVVAVAERIPARLIGDGRHSIAALVARQNEARQANPYHGAKPLALTPAILRNLAGQALDADSVPAPGQHVPLHAVANIGAGGESVDVTEQAHPAWADIAVRARQALFDSLHAGLDLIAHDIAQPPDAQTWAVTELNTNPDLGLHHFPMHGPGRDVASAILNAWFSPRTPPTLALRIIISGTVHHVGYRRWLWREAHLRTLQGWTRNHPDGTVVAVLHGPEPAVRDLVAKCEQGPARARVTGVTCENWTGDLPAGFTYLAKSLRTSG